MKTIKKTGQDYSTKICCVFHIICVCDSFYGFIFVDPLKGKPQDEGVTFLSMEGRFCIMHKLQKLLCKVRRLGT